MWIIKQTEKVQVIERTVSMRVTIRVYSFGIADFLSWSIKILP